ncbi:hypothetical protein KI387_028251, partial [Taxus chinensis]
GSGATSHKTNRHSKEECRAIKSLLAESSSSTLSAPAVTDPEVKDEDDEIIDADPVVIIATSKVKNMDEKERLFHSKLWVK